MGWDAMRLICGVDVAPDKEVRELIGEHFNAARLSGGKSWSDVAFEVSKEKLLGSLEPRVERSRNRPINREKAASSLAAAIVARQGSAGFPPLREDGSEVTSEHVRWLRAYARASGNDDVHSLLEFSLLCRRLAVRAASDSSMHEGSENSSHEASESEEPSAGSDNETDDLEGMLQDIMLERLATVETQGSSTPS